jgi:hypothetical protein
MSYLKKHTNQKQKSYRHPTIKHIETVVVAQIITVTVKYSTSIVVG